MPRSNDPGARSASPLGSTCTGCALPLPRHRPPTRADAVVSTGRSAPSRSTGGVVLPAGPGEDTPSVVHVFDTTGLDPRTGTAVRSRPLTATRTPRRAAVEVMAAASAVAAWAEALSLTAVAGAARPPPRESRRRSPRSWAAGTRSPTGADPATATRSTGSPQSRSAAALGVSTRTARDRVHLADDLARRQPAVLAAMTRGEVGVPHARSVRDALESLNRHRRRAGRGRPGGGGAGRGRRRPRDKRGPGCAGTPAQLGAAVRRAAARAGVDAETRCRAARARPAGPVLAVAGRVGGAAGHGTRRDRGRRRGLRRGAEPASLVDAAEGPLTLDQARADAALSPPWPARPTSNETPSRRVGLAVDVLVPLDVLLGSSGGRAGGAAGVRAPAGRLVARAVARALLGRCGWSRSTSTARSPSGASPAPPLTGPAPPGGHAGPDDPLRRATTRVRLTRVRLPRVWLTHAGRHVTPSDPSAPDRPGLGPWPGPGSWPGPGPWRSVRRGPTRVRGPTDPLAGVLRRVRARDVTCRWPGCTCARHAATSTTPCRSPRAPTT